jgi:hypothetical protein
VAALLLLGASGAAAALDLRTDPRALTAGQVEASQALLTEAADRLPPSMASSLDRVIEVQWRDDLPAQVHGRALTRRMLLDRRLLDGWRSRPADADAREPATRAALAAVIHELAHFHDRTPAGRLSLDRRLLDLAGWQVVPLRPGLRGPNAFTDRTPDRYELNDPAEFVAVNLEHFLLDPSYACRRPALHRHLAVHFGWSPPAPPCVDGHVFLSPDTDPATETDAAGALLSLDPARVWSVDYLLAEGNGQPMSRWGHSMLRLVVCAPGRAPGPDCRLDLQHHRVLSFRAFVDDVQISSWRGLTGSYPSRLFVLPLRQVIDEYTRVELRGLQSIPLRLQPAEIALLLERAAQLHWSYDGRYYFVSNNCAVETFKLLHDGVPRLAGEGLSSITPTGLLRRLRTRGIADASVLDDPAVALRLGYRFDAMSERYQAMFEAARETLPLAQSRVQDWLALHPRQRAPWIERSDLRAAAALLVLEQAALTRQELLARDELKRRFLGPDARPGASAEMRSRVQALLQMEGVFSRPAALLPGDGYGLPQPDERVMLQEQGARHARQLRLRTGEMREEGRALLSDERRESLLASEHNLDALGRHLRALHRAQGGVSID